MKRHRLGRRFIVGEDGRGVVGRSGTSLVARVGEALGLERELGQATRRPRPGAEHKRGGMLIDLAVPLVDGGTWRAARRPGRR